MMSLRPHSPFRRILLLNLAATIALAVIAGIAAFNAIGGVVERALKTDIEHEMHVLLGDVSGEVPLASIEAVTIAIGQRLYPELPNDGQAIYLLARADRTTIVGNATRWPDGVVQSAGWVHLDGKDIGAPPGPLLAHIEAVDRDFALLVGRRLTARDALARRFIPILVLSVIFLGGLSSLFLSHLDRRFRQRVDSFNSVFTTIQSGDISARIARTEDSQRMSEFDALGSNINSALDEVQRLFKGLDAYSQVAAHELNHAVSLMRDSFDERGDREGVQDADRLLELVSHILQLAQIEAMPSFMMKRFSLSNTVRSAVVLYSDTFDEKGVRLLSSLEDDRIDIFGSQPLVQSAVTNLLSNAVKFAPTDSVVTVKVERKNDQVELSVQDEGPGVDVLEITDLALRARQGESGGNGFGLQYVQAIAIRHGARLTLSHADPGLRVSISFQCSFN